MTHEQAWQRYEQILAEAAERCADSDRADRQIKSLLESEPAVWQIVRDHLAREAYMRAWCQRRANLRQVAVGAPRSAKLPIRVAEALGGLGATFHGVMAMCIYGRRIGSLTREECLELAERSEREAQGHLWNAGWLRRLAGKIAAGKTVEQCVTAADLEGLREPQPVAAE